MSQWGVQATDSWFFWHIVDATDYVTPETGLVSTDICVNLAYSPMYSFADENEARERIAPTVERIIKDLVARGG